MSTFEVPGTDSVESVPGTSPLERHSRGQLTAAQGAIEQLSQTRKETS